jgi:hypothetical protein
MNAENKYLVKKEIKKRNNVLLETSIPFLYFPCCHQKWRRKKSSISFLHFKEKKIFIFSMRKSTSEKNFSASLNDNLQENLFVFLEKNI